MRRVWRAVSASWGGVDGCRCRSSARYLRTGPLAIDAILNSSVSEDQNQQVTVRRLPDGCSHAALLQGLEGLSLRIDLDAAAAASDVKAGDLVEVSGLKTMYLGEVRDRRGAAVTIGVEHALDRETLARIRQVWHVRSGQ